MIDKKNILNLLAAIIAFSSNIIINFFLSPYIIENVGIEAYGFFSLSMNFIMYMSIITIAINSMSGRFITISVYEKKMDKAKQYYSSALFTNLIIGIVIFVVLIPMIYNFEYILNIPNNILLDVKILFLLVIISFVLETMLTIFSVAYILRNKLYLSYGLQIKGNILKLVILLLLFYMFKPHIFYLGIGILVYTIYIKLYDLYYKRILMKEIFFKKIYLDWISFKEMFFSGIWNSITRIGNVLSGNLDLIIVNMYLNSFEMGILALSKMVPTFLNAITATVANVYMPKFLELYAKKMYEELILEVKMALKVFSIFLSIPLVCFIVYGKEFFSLWVPNQNAEYIYILSISSLLAIIVIGPVAIMHNIFTVVNKIKVNSILIVFTGLINVGGCILILHYTNWGLLAVVLLTAILSLLRNILYTVPYGAIYFKCKWYTFFPILLRAFFAVLFVSISGLFIKKYFIINTWKIFFISIIVLMIYNILMQLLIIFSNEERRVLYLKLKYKVKSIK